MEVLKAIDENMTKTISLLLKGGVVVCPTDTVYGLMADVHNKNAVEKIFKIKNRSFKKPLPVFVRDLEMAKSLAIIDKRQGKILERIWPGKVTVVLRAKVKILPRGIISEDKKIGLRVPDHRFLNSLLNRINRPLAQTSANISNKSASTEIRKVLAYFKGNRVKPDLVLDEENLKKSLSSTVIDLTNYRILRKGEVSKKKILKE